MEEQILRDETGQQWHHVVTIEDLGGLRRKVGVVYDAEAVRMAFGKAGKEVGRRAMINGFRRGKAPKALVERFCAKEIESAASAMLAQEGYLHAVYEHKFAALSEPKVENTRFGTDGTFSCEITVEVKPTIVPSGYMGLRLSRPSIDPSRTIEAMMGELRSRFAKFEERDRVAPGMTVVIDYRILVDGLEIAHHHGVPFQVGEGGGLPLGDARVAGLGTEASVVARLTLPPDFGNHGGKEAEARITVRKILESVLPTDEELAAHSGLGSVDELVRDVRRHADAEIARQAHQALEAQVVDTLLDTHQFDVPSEWIERESRYLTRQLGIGGQVDDGTAKAVRELAERNVRRSFMLDAIYDAEPTLRVKAEEMEAVLDREADKQSVPKTQLKRMLLKQGMMDSIVELVKSKKIMDFLISNAEISTEGAETAPQTA